MRDELLKKSQLVARAISLQSLQTLSGTEKDLDKSDYRLLKEQLNAIQSANSQCRFVYLMGRRSSAPEPQSPVRNKVFFFMDVGQKDSAMPGEWYSDSSDELLSSFDTGKAFVEGPLPDEWGNWISGIVPIIDPQTSKVVAVLGMDFDAQDWFWNVAAKAALPIGFMAVFLIGGAVLIISVRSTSSLPKPILRHLFPSLAFMIVFLVVGAAFLLHQQHRAYVTEEVLNNCTDVNRKLRGVVTQQAEGLAATVQPILADFETKKALRQSDTNTLYTVWRPVFETLRHTYHITHFYFMDTNRICILRLYKSEKSGDRIDRFTARNAELTGQTSSGIELGSFGTMTLRMVQPVYDERRLIGYIELGREIEDVLRGVQIQQGLYFAVLVHKEHIKREGWAEGRRLLGRPDNWDLLSRSAVYYSSLGVLPDAIINWADQATKPTAQYDRNREIIS
jgi:hypothetical protein